jgi:hypothetical protein
MFEREKEIIGTIFSTPMGIKGYLSMIKRSFRPSHIPPNKIYDYVFIDGNCIVHSSIKNFAIPYPNWEVYTEKYEDQIVSDFIRLLSKVKWSKVLYIVFDGQPPFPKMDCQKRRREGRFEVNCIVLPNTMIMNNVELKIAKALPLVKILSSTSEGEGEQKIISLMTDILGGCCDEKCLIITFDSDILILTHIRYLMRNRSFTSNIVDINYPNMEFTCSLHKLVELWRRLDINTVEQLLFIAICFGNDFLPPLTDFKNLPLTRLTIKELISPHRKPTFKTFQTTSCLLVVSDNEECPPTNIQHYTSRVKWFKDYFVHGTSDMDTGDTVTQSPCCHCVNKFRSVQTMRSNSPTHHNKFSHNEYLGYVLEPYLIEKLRNTK